MGVDHAARRGAGRRVPQRPRALHLRLLQQEDRQHALLDHHARHGPLFEREGQRGQRPFLRFRGRTERGGDPYQELLVEPRADLLLQPQ